MKKRLWFIVIIFLLVSIYLISNSYALFETNSGGAIEGDVGKWIIKLNDNLISGATPTTFNIDSFQYTENIHTDDGYISPGREGYFDIVLDPTGTQVAVKYDISLNLSNFYSDNISLNVSVSDGQDIIKTAENTYSGVFSLNDIENEVVKTLRIGITWIDDVNYDADDTQLGLAGGSISIPVSVSASQYNGEEIIPYSE